MQAGILGLGAYLVIGGEGSAGIIIAASIIMSRALAPIEAMIAHWRGFVSARQSYRRLVGLFRQISHEAQPTLDLPQPQKSLVVESLTIAPPGELRPVVQGVQFSLVAGDGLGIIGPSASGKSTLHSAAPGNSLAAARLVSVTRRSAFARPPSNSQSTALKAGDPSSGRCRGLVSSLDAQPLESADQLAVRRLTKGCCRLKALRGPSLPRRAATRLSGVWLSGCTFSSMRS